MEDYPFKNPKSRRLFEFLKDAYVKDDEVLRIPLDRCGWRSLVQIGQGTGFPANTLYGSSPGHLGAELQDLLKDNLVEMRYFIGERGRGGEVRRFRIALPRNQQAPKESQTNQYQSHSQIKDEMTKAQQLGRRLAAIMFTDIVGFTALGQRDESLSLVLLEEQGKQLRPIFQRHNGRVVKTMGDSFLVEFPNALDAVRCAHDIQRAAREFNIGSSVQKQIRLRVGIHLGDVVGSSTGDILGDAVNVASRIEPLADSGGVCLTRQVYDQVRNKIDLTFTSLGEKSLKNVNLPIEVFKLDLPWDEIGIEPRGKVDNNRIAVLPFANMSPDPNDEYFVDGMTEELISTISKIPALTVISRTSAMKFKNSKKTTTEIGRELNVGKILEGSVRKSGNNLRITTQLIDSINDAHLWNQSYDKELEDIFAIQSEIAIKVSQALMVQLLSNEKRDLERRATGNTQAYTLYLKGRYHWNERTKEDLDKAVKYFEEAIKLDSRYALAYSGLADCYIFYGAYGWMKPGDSFPRAKQYALKSIEIDPRLAEPHATLADVFDSYEGMWKESETEYKLALELKPSYTTAHMWYGLLLMDLTRFEEAREQMEFAIELDPLFWVARINLAGLLTYAGRPREAAALLEAELKEDPELPYALDNLGWAYYLDSRREEGITELRKAVTISEGDPILKADLACALGFSGQSVEAGDILRELEETSQVNYFSKMKLAQVYFALGKKDEGFRLLEEARENHSLFTQHGSYLLDMRILPWFASVREDPRWELFVKRLGITQPGSS